MRIDIRVHKKNVHGEYRVTERQDGKRIEENTYFTNDLADANETAKDMFNRAWDRSPDKHVYVRFLNEKKK